VGDTSELHIHVFFIVRILIVRFFIVRLLFCMSYRFLSFLGFLLFSLPNFGWASVSPMAFLVAFEATSFAEHLILLTGGEGAVDVHSVGVSARGARMGNILGVATALLILLGMISVRGTLPPVSVHLHCCCDKLVKVGRDVFHVIDGCYEAIVETSAKPFYEDNAFLDRCLANQGFKRGDIFNKWSTSLFEVSKL